MVDRKKLAIDFAKSLNHPEIEKIILFGSVARGEDTKDSDIDILIVTNKRSDKFKIKGDIYNKVWNILLNTGEKISVKMRSISYYEENISYSFLYNISKDGILISWVRYINLIEDVQLVFNSALESLEDSQIAIDNRRYKMAINRSYYAVFHAARALLFKKEIITKTHSGTIRKFGLEYVINDSFDAEVAKILSSLEDEREDVDYDYRFTVTKRDAVEAINDAKKFIEECEKFL